MKNETNKEKKYVLSGQRLRQCRKNANLTQEELVSKIEELPGNRGKERNAKTIGRMERGDAPISADYANLLSQIFNCNPNWLMGYTKFKTVGDRDQLLKDQVDGSFIAAEGTQDGNIGKLLAGNIKRYRARRGLSQVEFAEAASLELEKIKEYENDAQKISINELGKISDALMVEIATLYNQAPAPLDIQSFSASFDGNGVTGPALWVVEQILGALNSKGCEAAISMLQGLAQNPRYKKQNVDTETKSVDSD